jgi:hypothetical protein
MQLNSAKPCNSGLSNITIACCCKVPVLAWRPRVCLPDASHDTCCRMMRIHTNASGLLQDMTHSCLRACVLLRCCRSPFYVIHSHSSCCMGLLL